MSGVRGMLRTTYRGWIWEVEGRAVGFAMGNRATVDVVVDYMLEHPGNEGIEASAIVPAKARILDLSFMVFP